MKSSEIKISPKEKSVVMIIGYRYWFRVVGCVCFLIFFLLDLKLLIESSSTAEYWIYIPISICLLYGLLHLAVTKIEITEEEVVLYGFMFRISIRYIEINRVEIFKNFLIIKSKGKEIRITADLTDQSKAISFIINKLRHRFDEVDVKVYFEGRDQFFKDGSGWWDK